MIEKITIKNFKSFKDVSLKLGPMNLFIGANASGKSNFFDALRVLQGIGYGFTLREILDGKPKSATSEVWEGIRGGSMGTPFASEEEDVPTLFKVSGKLSGKGDIAFRIVFQARDGLLSEEQLSISGKIIYGARMERSADVAYAMYHPGVGQVDRDRPRLSHIARDGNRKAEQATRVLADLQ